MKKIAFLMVAVAAVMMTACSGKKLPKADVKNDGDSLSYAYGYANGGMFAMRSGLDMKYVEHLMRGMAEGAAIGEDSTKIAYMIGMQLGFQMQNDSKGINDYIMGEDGEQYVSLNNILAGFVAGAKNDSTVMDLDYMKAQDMFRSLMEAKRAEVNSKKYEPNKKAGADFMAEVAKKDGVKELGNGVYYEVITEGTGATAKMEDHVSVRYEGQLIDGTVFDKSDRDGKDEPATFYAGGVVPGFALALTNMPAGSKWKVYIPYDQAYGEQAAGSIEPYSTLVFIIEVVEVNPAK